MASTFPKRPVAAGIAFINEALRNGWAEEARGRGIDAAEADEWRAWYERDVCAPFVVHEGPDGATEIDAGAGDAVDVDSLPLIVRDVEQAAFAGRIYPLERDGLYRFMVLTRSLRNLIVARQGRLAPMLEGLAGLQVHGNREDGDALDTLEARLPTCAFACITCGKIAALAAQVLQRQGFRTRLASGLTTDDWNTYDNGHALFEVFDPEAAKWILADLDMGYLFRRDGVLLDAGEVWEGFQRGTPLELAPLAKAIVDPFFSSANGFNWFLRFRWKWQSEEGKLNWYRRVLQNVSIAKDGQRIFVGDAEKIRTYVGPENARVLPYAEWRERLYER